MTAPHLNRKLVLEAPVRVPDGAGGFAQTWIVLGEHWVELNVRSGRERLEANAPVSAVSYRIVLRAHPQGSSARPYPEQRFRDGARVFVIRAVAEHDRFGRYLVCFADEEVAA